MHTRTINEIERAARRILGCAFDSAIAAAKANICLPQYLPAPPRGRTVVIGAGKAAAAMAKVVEDNWQGPISGAVVTRYGHGTATKFIEIIEAAHPVPDNVGERAARHMMNLVQGLTSDDLVLCLISGGGSALLSAPVDGLGFSEKQDINRALLRSGAAIAEINCVRKHLSAVKGGRLALLCAPARVETMLISDIPGDDPGLIASGPTVPDASTCADALAVIDKYAIALPSSVRLMLKKGTTETPKPGDPRFLGHRTSIIASASTSLDAAAKWAHIEGIESRILSDRIEGEARVVAAEQANMAIQIMRQQSRQPSTPFLLLSGGETSVTVRGNGRGGRNAEFLLALAIALDGLLGVYAIACDTDGIDGSEDNAGAVLTPDTLARASVLGLDPLAHLNNNDAYGFFSALNDLVVTGPTLTNVNDFRAILFT